MVVTTTKYQALEIKANAGTNQNGYKLGFVDSGLKPLQNDKWTLTNASAIAWGMVVDDSAGTVDAITISTNTATMTGAATLATSGLFIMK